MAVVSNRKADYAAQYTGFDKLEVGLGSISPNVFATQGYRKKKIDNILIGGLQEIRYTGAEHDLNPLILTIGYEAAYNTILAYNLNYVPVQFRKAMINLILQSNHARIKGQKPLVIDYQTIKQGIPESAKIVRRYKLQGIKVIDQYPIVEWQKIIKKKSRWQGWYKNQGKSQKGFWASIDNLFKRRTRRKK